MKTPKAKKAKTPRKARKGAAVTEADLPKRVLKGSIVPNVYKAAMAEHKDTNGSKLALVLKEATTMLVDDSGEDSEGGKRAVLDVEALKAIAKKNGIDFAPYAHLNNGQKRMNVGNKLRGLINDGVTVDIAGTKLSGASAVKSKTAGIATAKAE